MNCPNPVLQKKYYEIAKEMETEVVAARAVECDRAREAPTHVPLQAKEPHPLVAQLLDNLLRMVR